MDCSDGRYGNCLFNFFIYLSASLQPGFGIRGYFDDDATVNGRISGFFAGGNHFQTPSWNHPSYNKPGCNDTDKSPPSLFGWIFRHQLLGPWMDASIAYSLVGHHRALLFVGIPDGLFPVPDSVHLPESYQQTERYHQCDDIRLRCNGQDC